MQAGNMEKAVKYSEKTLSQIDRLRPSKRYRIVYRRVRLPGQEEKNGKIIPKMTPFFKIL